MSARPTVGLKAIICHPVGTILAKAPLNVLIAVIGWIDIDWLWLLCGHAAHQGAGAEGRERIPPAVRVTTIAGTGLTVAVMTVVMVGHRCRFAGNIRVLLVRRLDMGKRTGLDFISGPLSRFDRELAMFRWKDRFDGLNRRLAHMWPDIARLILSELRRFVSAGVRS